MFVFHMRRVLSPLLSDSHPRHKRLVWDSSISHTRHTKCISSFAGGLTDVYNRYLPIDFDDIVVCWSCGIYFISVSSYCIKLCIRNQWSGICIIQREPNIYIQDTKCIIESFLSSIHIHSCPMFLVSSFGGDIGYVTRDRKFLGANPRRCMHIPVLPKWVHMKTPWILSKIVWDSPSSGFLSVDHMSVTVTLNLIYSTII